MLIDKIKERLKAKFPGVNLSKTRIDALAAKLNAIVTEESGIDAALEQANQIFPFEEIAREDDRVRSLEAKAKGPQDPQNPPKPGEDPKPDPIDVPAWAKSLIDSNQALQAKLEAIEKGKTKETFLQKATKALAEKKIPDAFAKGFLKSFEAADETELEAFLSEVETSYTEFKQTSNNERFDNSQNPFVSAGTPETVKNDIKAWAESKKPVSTEN